MDMVLFGPGIAVYKSNAEISATLDPNQEAATILLLIPGRLKIPATLRQLPLDSGML